MDPQGFLLVLKWGAASFPAVYSQLAGPFGKCTIWPQGFEPLKGGLVPSTGAICGKSTHTDLTRNTRAPHFTPQHWLLCHKGLY